jgi:hypothetical protein
MQVCLGRGCIFQLWMVGASLTGHDGPWGIGGLHPSGSAGFEEGAGRQLGVGVCNGLVVVAHTCNPGYSGGRDLRITL